VEIYRSDDCVFWVVFSSLAFLQREALNRWHEDGIGVKSIECITTNLVGHKTKTEHNQG
jgi:hypothetical protein